MKFVNLYRQRKPLYVQIRCWLQKMTAISEFVIVTATRSFQLCIFYFYVSYAYQQQQFLGNLSSKYRWQILTIAFELSKQKVWRCSRCCKT